MAQSPFIKKWLSRQSKKSKEIPITLYYCRDLSFLKLSSLFWGVVVSDPFRASITYYAFFKDVN